VGTEWCRDRLITLVNMGLCLIKLILHPMVVFLLPQLVQLKAIGDR
jgi:3-deoxy-D-arabino-heptulosonate 7-phosphate (DAHP) synthase